MVDWDKLEGFEWDDGNSRKSDVKHDVSMADSEQVFFNAPLLILEDSGHSRAEPRWHALGRNDASRLLHVTFTLRSDGKLIRVISVLDMHRKERKIYAQER